MAKKVPEQNEYYTRLIVYPQRRNLLFVLLTVLVAGMTFAIFQYNVGKFSQNDLTVAIVISGALLCLYPIIEEWEYKPWQSKAIQYEKHYNGQNR